jgi:hypothetical protein
VQVDHARAAARQLGGRKSGDRADRPLAPIIRLADRMWHKRMAVDCGKDTRRSVGWHWWLGGRRIASTHKRTIALIRKGKWEYLGQDWWKREESNGMESLELTISKQGGEVIW